MAKHSIQALIEDFRKELPTSLGGENEQQVLEEVTDVWILSRLIAEWAGPDLDLIRQTLTGAAKLCAAHWYAE